jgi:SPX domain protein involved in polyphosphate accumulation
LENVSKVEEYAKKLQRFEKKAEEEAKLFDIDEFLADVDKTLEKHVEGVGLIRYKRLSFIEVVELSQKHGDDQMKFSIALVVEMLSKADPTVTFEKFGRLPPIIATKIMSALAEELKTDFLQTTKS